MRNGHDLQPKALTIGAWLRWVLTMGYPLSQPMFGLSKLRNFDKVQS